MWEASKAFIRGKLIAETSKIRNKKGKTQENEIKHKERSDRKVL